jgi:hypothetical protein
MRIPLRTLARTMTSGTQVGEIRLPRRPAAECLVGSQGVIGMPEAVDLDRKRVAVADDRPILQGAEESFDDIHHPAVGAEVVDVRTRSASATARRRQASASWPRLVAVTVAARQYLVA